MYIYIYIYIVNLTVLTSLAYHPSMVVRSTITDIHCLRSTLSQSLTIDWHTIYSHSEIVAPSRGVFAAGSPIIPIIVIIVITSNYTNISYNFQSL